ncbi:hypothetical protein DFR47_11528 [Pseudochrobactrum asaccharolyticum]|uniref:Uncharacterized protein n=1 Tax=Pseudochrobactrum asaccharolyticum TaxID=354351 RepID=A0A366DI10_9HYPH|nr:hypothetical protein DFR47_11528 [Pseudochrobactrum asaccharolyticum]
MKEAIEQLITNDMAIISATVDSTTLLIQSLVDAKVLTKEQAAASLHGIADHMHKLSQNPNIPDQKKVLTIISDRYREKANAFIK